MKAAIWLCGLVACTPAVAWQPADVTPIDPPPLVAQASQPDLSAFDEPDAAIAQLARDGRAVEALVESEWVKRFARGADALPAVAPFQVGDTTVDSQSFYFTKYGSPLAYARALDRVAAAGMPAPRSLVDFGYGTIGHLRLLATLGARSIGIDVDPWLRDMYAGAQGRFDRGSVRLLHGSFPSELAAEVGSGHDLFISKNVLKRGYIHPEQEVPAKQTIDLGVSDEAFLKAIHDALAPGGYAMIYNITPPPNGPGLPYRTWADGRSPFTRAQWQAAGFEVIAFDADDSAAARAQGKALGWDRDADVDQNIFAMYTLARRR